MSVIEQAEHPHQNPDPITHAPGSHPVGTGIGGAVGGAIAGAAIGTAVGPVGTAIGAAIGAIAGGLAGHAVAEAVNPTEAVVSGTVVADSAAKVDALPLDGLPVNDAMVDEVEMARTQFAGGAKVVDPTIDADRGRYSAPPTHAIIEITAYYIWEKKGRSDGHALEDWLQAESSAYAA